MPRKKILHGGKKDELIAAALKLFMEHGYESTSIHMILNEVGGEVGMFYHYFSSKQEIFDEAAEMFLQKYASAFGDTLKGCKNTGEIFESILNLLKENLAKYKTLNHKNFHWSTQIALNEMALASIVPFITSVIGELKLSGVIQPSIDCSDRELAAYILYGARAILHEKSMLELSEVELQAKWRRIKELTLRILNHTLE